MILGIWLKIEKLSAGQRGMYILISGSHTFGFRAWSYLIVIRWNRWRAWPWWWGSWWRCTRACVPPVSLWIHGCAILGRKVAVSLIFPNHCRCSFYRSLHLVMPGTHNSLLRPFLNLGVWIHVQLLCFLNRGARKPFFSHFGQIQGKTHVGLFQLYLTALSCHSSWHVESLQEISCCI